MAQVTGFLAELVSFLVELALYVTLGNVAATVTTIVIILFFVVDPQPQKTTSNEWSEPEEDKPRTGSICLIGVLLASTASLYLSQGLYLSPRWFWLAALFALILLGQMVLLSLVSMNNITPGNDFHRR
jgi:small-conductance mechanosensitive channel